MEERKGITCVVALRAALRRTVRFCAGRKRGRPEGSAGKDKGLSLFSRGTLPGHEADFQSILRLLWEIGKGRPPNNSQS
jgi:hypothetical protein